MDKNFEKKQINNTNEFGKKEGKFNIEESPIKEAYILLNASTPLELSNNYTAKDQEQMRSGSWDYSNQESIVNKIKNILESVNFSTLSNEEEKEWVQEIIWFWYHHAISCAVWRYKDKDAAKRYANKALEYQSADHPNKISKLLYFLVNDKFEDAEKWVDQITEEPEKSTAISLIQDFKKGDLFNVDIEKNNDLLNLITEKYQLSANKEEKQSFDKWLKNTPESSLENPIQIEKTIEILKFLPNYGNYTDQKVNIFFYKENFSIEDLDLILKSHSENEASFEISVVLHNENTISIGIGNKANNCSTLINGDILGHYHPILKYESPDNLPYPFIKGLLPSHGDIKACLKYPDLFIKGTRIYSKHGYTEIKLEKTSFDNKNPLANFKEKYFKLFLGENKYHWKNDQDIIDYYKDNFNLIISFHYNEK